MNKKVIIAASLLTLLFQTNLSNAYVSPEVEGLINVAITEVRKESTMAPDTTFEYPSEDGGRPTRVSYTKKQLQDFGITVALLENVLKKAKKNKDYKITRESFTYKDNGYIRFLTGSYDTSTSLNIAKGDPSGPAFKAIRNLFEAIKSGK